MRFSTSIPALLVALVVACDSGAYVDVQTPPAAVHVTSVDTLRPGQIAQIRGSGLTGLRSLLLDGVTATEIVVRSDGVADFRVPSMRTCETDMRIVKVSAEGSASIDAIVRVPASVTLSVGESRVLTEDDLKCLRLAAANQDYVLSAANVAVPMAATESLTPLVTVRVRGTGFPSASTLASFDAGRQTPFSAQRVDTPIEPPLPELAALKGSYSQAPVPFDSRYATAVVGDTLRFIDWYSGTPQICQQPVESVPSFPAKVVAISGQVVVAVDLRHASAPAYMDPTKLGWIRNAAAMTDKLLLPTMRSLFNPDYLPPAGGGGRFYLLLGTLPAGFQNFTGYAFDGQLPAVTIASQAICPRASEMVVSTIAADKLLVPPYSDAHNTASLFLHEYAHNADMLASGNLTPSGIISEGLATLAQETASRIGSGQSLHARHSGVDNNAPPPEAAALGLWGTQPALGPWQFNGRYGANARMLLFLRELAGEASVDHGRRPTLFQRFMATPVNWTNRPAVIVHIASVLGVGYTDIIDRHTLASVTAGLIDPGITHDLPRYTSWDHSERAVVSGPRSSGFAGRANRYATTEYTLAAADGGHAALYLMGDGPRGVSLELVSIIPAARIVRLTRLR